MARAAKDYGATEFEASRWKPTLAGGDILPSDFRVCSLPPKTCIYIEAPPPPPGADGFALQGAVRLTKATPRSPREEPSALMSVTVVLKPDDGVALDASGGNLNLPSREGIKMKVAVNVNDPAVSLRAMIEQKGFTIDPEHRLYSDDRIVVGEHLSFQQLRISRHSILSYKPSPTSPRRMRGSDIQGSSIGGSRITSRATSPRSRPLSPSSRAPPSSTSFYQNSPNHTSMNGRGDYSFSRGDRSGLSTPQPFSLDLSRTQQNRSQISGRTEHVSPSGRRSYPIEMPGGTVRILFEDPEDGGYTYEVHASVDRQVGSLFEFINDPERFELHCDGHPIDVSESFLAATRGLPGTLFTFHPLR